MGEVVTNYSAYFRAVRAFNQRPASERSKICDTYFNTVRINMSFRAQLHLDAYAARVRSQDRASTPKAG